MRPVISLAAALMLAATTTTVSTTAADDSTSAGPRERVRIYQLMVRLFGNTNPTRKTNGTLAENGVGKFADINDAALGSLKGMGFTHLWLTGVLQQATGTDYADIGKPADDPDLLKGLAGSPYAIKDYFDVCPDYAQEPARRLEEFRALLERMHRHGLKAIIDFVPNHVARSYHSATQPEWDFGVHDDRSQFFRRDNHFFYLPKGNPTAGQVPPLKLPTFDCKTGEPLSPTCRVLGGKCDGLFGGETEFGRVTGSNVVSWTPGKDSWYETIKLNYGFDFTDPAKQRKEYPRAGFPDVPVPDTWQKMDHILGYWQGMGVDGFRCDMAHWIPPEFWRWAIGKARGRQPGVFFVAEAYDDDPNKVAWSGETAPKHAMQVLLEAGFDAVYDDPSYKIAKRIYEGPAWANDLDAAARNDLIFQRGLRYAENHDEVRLAAPSQWGGVGREAGRAVCGLLFALSRGPVMIYSGQEVGEPAAGAEGFGGDDARTSIFDYWSMPELAKWVGNKHDYQGSGLSHDQKDLRGFYGRLVQAADEPAFRDGAFFPLNSSNAQSQNFGVVDGDAVGGHWLYACLRYDAATKQRILVVANLHPTKTFEKVQVHLPVEATRFLGLSEGQGMADRVTCKELLHEGAVPSVGCFSPTPGTMDVVLDAVPPVTPYYLVLGVPES